MTGRHLLRRHIRRARPILPAVRFNAILLCALADAEQYRLQLADDPGRDPVQRQDDLDLAGDYRLLHGLLDQEEKP